MTAEPNTVGGETARDFLVRAFAAGDWVALFAKAYDSGRVLQWVAPVATFCEARWSTWMRVMNEYRFNIYVSVNAMTPHRRQRTKASVGAIRHIFLDVDHDAPDVLNRVMSRADLPAPSCVIHSSPGRAQVLWRVQGFSAVDAERLQKYLAIELGGDRCATAVSQTMRVPGFANHKYSPPPIVGVEYGSDGVFTAADFPKPPAPGEPQASRTTPVSGATSSPDVVGRARRYLAAVPPAVAGQGGDLRTFRLCCRLVRGFALTPEIALPLLAEWNDRCEPPWTERELAAKLEHAWRYGREPVGGLLRLPP